MKIETTKKINKTNRKDYNMTNKKLSDILTDVIKKEEKRRDKPEQGKIYALTGGYNDKCILNGNTWAESIVTEGSK